MIWFDYIIIIIIISSTIISLRQGFVHESISLATWIGAFYITSHYYKYLAFYFTHFEDKIVRNIIAIILIFTVLMITGIIINYIVVSFIRKTGLTNLDRILGIFFGILRGVLIISAIIFFLNTFTDYSQSYNWNKSVIIPQFNCVIDWLLKYIHNYHDILYK